MSEEAPLRKAAEARVAERSFAHETPQLENQEKIDAIDQKIAALRARMRGGSETRFNIKDPKIISIAEKIEDGINAEIAQLEKDKAILTGGTSVN